MLNPADAFRMTWENLMHECPDVHEVKQLVGGSINHVFRVESDRGIFVMKINSLAKYPEMFKTEARGLTTLSETKSISCPEVIGYSELESHQILLIEYIQEGKPLNDFFEDFANRLATLHRVTSSHFGLKYNNYIGRLSQDNTEEKTILDFFIQRRLLPQLHLAVKSETLDTSSRTKFDVLLKKLPTLLPNEEAALLHGDLWSGNFIAGENGTVSLIDPAIHYGSRESEIAMTKLFGGFDHSFYSTYQNAFPMQNRWEERVDLWNLYPLLVHVNLFGTSYIPDLIRILNKYVV